MELDEVVSVHYPAFTVIGKLGEGLAAEGSSWVPPLWQLANEHFEELASVVQPESLSVLHLWGLMSDSSSWLAPWQEVGQYLAGLEVPSETPTPAGWTRWEMPAMDYLTVKTDVDGLETTMEQMFTDVLPALGAKLSAAVQEYYEPEFSPGEVVLYFPVVKE